jgi:ureidoglycolate lyase
MVTDYQTDHDIRSIKAELVTRNGFEPFGDVLGIDGLDALALSGIYEGLDVFRPAFSEADEPIEYLLNRMKMREFRVLYLERHPDLTQMMVPLGDPMIVVVARPGAREENGIPAFEELHAFLVPRDAGLSLKRGTWHEVPFSLANGGLVLETSSRSLTQAFHSGLNELREIEINNLVKRNFTARSGYILRVELP